jgi:hypothetical protein
MIIPETHFEYIVKCDYYFAGSFPTCTGFFWYDSCCKNIQYIVVYATNNITKYKLTWDLEKLLK